MNSEFISIKDYEQYTIVKTSTCIEALDLINNNKIKVLFVITETKIVVGSLTDGDIRRALLKGVNIKTTNVSEICNINFFKVNKHHSIISEINFPKNIEAFPVIDSNGILIGAFVKNDSLSENKLFTNRVLMIAEIGNNHQGSLEMGMRLIDEAVDSGADVVKFQMRHLDEVYNMDYSMDLSTEYTIDLLKKHELSIIEYFKLFDYAKSKGIIPICTPFDLKSLEVLEKYGLSAYKVASSDLTNLQLIDNIILTGKHFILSTGMSNDEEVEQIVKYICQKTKNFSLLHCNSTYPAPYAEINLKYMLKLKDLSPKYFGYSGHERGIEVPIAAVALGAKIIEKHFTLDKNLEGNDHRVSLLPSEFKQMVDCIRNVELSLGSEGKRSISQAERINRENLAKSVFLNRDLNIGDNVDFEFCYTKSPGVGMSPLDLLNYSKRKLTVNKKRNEPLFKSDFEKRLRSQNKINFEQKWGIPVRYHDMESLIHNKNYEIIEFHLSYNDLDLNIEKYVPEIKDMDFVVHCPELFKGDQLLDLASTDKIYLQRSIDNLNRTIDVTNKISKRFSSNIKPKLIVNCGGWSLESFLSEDEKKFKLGILIEVLAKLDLSSVEFLPQTMPPFPWHFGGQRFHNLMVTNEDISEFLCNTNFNICFDTSHTMLSSVFRKFDFYDLLESITNRISHYHMVDSKGIYDEGLQIGEGEIDFKRIFSIIPKTKKVSFIPEIWQGHKNNGFGFDIALKKLYEIKNG